MMRQFCILGESLPHTISPTIHQRLFDLSEKKGDYCILELTPEQLLTQSDFLKSFTGYNVTIPHKVKIIPFIDNLDATAKRYGAINCVHNKDGISTGYNTDVFGFLCALKSGGGNLGGKVLLLGCGGAGRMMAIEAALANSELTIAVRESSMEKAQKVLEDILILKPDAKVTITSLNSIQGSFDLLVNSTPVGMYPDTDKCPVSDDVIRNCKCVFDAIYNPTETLLLKKSIEFGGCTINGMAMLVWQAVAAHEIWDNASYTAEEIDLLITQMQEYVKRVF